MIFKMTSKTINRNPHNINAILLLNKSLKESSNYALQKVKRLYNASKAGHSGSLDPLATGMLPICFGRALKFIEFLLDSDKRYRVTAKLGCTTTTGDTEGEILTKRDSQHISPSMIETVLKNFLGDQQQIPPMFSALKYQGQPLYKLARKGKTIERAPRNIVIHNLQLLNANSDYFSLEVHCSSGTYIRTLIQDIGEALNCGAHVTSLHRSHVAHYSPEQMVTLEELQQSDNLQQYLIPFETIVKDMREIVLDEQQSIALIQGQKITLADEYEMGLIKLMDHRRKFIGIGEVSSEQILAPRKICA